MYTHEREIRYIVCRGGNCKWTAITVAVLALWKPRPPARSFGRRGLIGPYLEAACPRNLRARSRVLCTLSYAHRERISRILGASVKPVLASSREAFMPFALIRMHSGIDMQSRYLRWSLSPMIVYVIAWLFNGTAFGTSILFLRIIWS